MSDLLRTPLYDWHVAHGGRMVEFGGWEMPVQYTGIVEEHLAVRQAAGLFDISHMGRLRFRGPWAAARLDHLLTCSVATLKVGQIRYGLMCRDDGGVLDDILVARIADDDYSLVVNASNRNKVVDWIRSHTNQQFDDETQETQMIAVQGPQAIHVIQPHVHGDLSKLRYYTGYETEIVEEVQGWVSRTGYTGEDGFELVIPASAYGVWDEILASADDSRMRPCGLGARDTLRLEAAMPLYGHELTEDTDPLTAGLGFAVKLDKPDFLGKAALVEIAKRTDRPVRVGLQLDGRRIAREGCAVFAGADRIGEVTSGTFSPTRQQAIAMAYVASAHAAVGTPVEIDVRGKREAAKVVPLPFYKRG
jgi:aminomethyltransferase